MPREIRLRLWIAAGIGAVLMFLLAAWRLAYADTPARPITADVCTLVRPATIAVLVPGAGAPESGVDTKDGHTIVRFCDRHGSAGELDVYLVRFGRFDGRTPVQRAHAAATFQSCFRCPRRSSEPRIGDESWEYSFSPDSVELLARFGATVVGVRMAAATATRDGMREAIRSVAQEVLAACGKAC
jgi:hypothetical protein